MTPILTVTLNPALDLSTATEAVVPGRKLRCAAPESYPGGGGINVSRAIAILGGQSRAFVTLGGATGQRLAELLRTEAIPCVVIAAPGETRQSLSVSETSTGAQFRFVMPGPEWDTGRIAKALAAIAGAAEPGSFVVVSGSQPPGVAADFPARLAAALTGKAARLVLDTSGEALHHLVQTASASGLHRLHVLRMDHLEAEGLAGQPLPSRRDSADFAQGLVRRGLAEVVVVARGADGSILATEGRRLHVAAAQVPVASPIGAGDSFVGAFTLALARDEGLDLALAKGAAAASAAVMTEATKLCRRADAERLLAESPVTEI